ncbi:MAG: DUF177 domain-containing protein [Oscillospiraceae bacterium]
MLVNLSKIFQREETEKQLDLEFDFKDEDVSQDAKFQEPVKATVNLEKSRGQTSVKLSVSAKAVCSCARCLKLFEHEFNFSQEFSVTPDILTQSEPMIPVSSDNILDIKQLVLQELTLEIPTALLCREDCPGLCSVCGKPKEENCNCQTTRVDPRLLILKQLLDDNDN